MVIPHFLSSIILIGPRPHFDPWRSIPMDLKNLMVVIVIVMVSIMMIVPVIVMVLTVNIDLQAHSTMVVGLTTGPQK